MTSDKFYKLPISLYQAWFCIKSEKSHIYEKEHWNSYVSKTSNVKQKYQNEKASNQAEQFVEIECEKGSDWD